MSRFFSTVLSLLLLTTFAVAAEPLQGPPDFGLDKSGTIRQLNLRDPSTGERLPMGGFVAGNGQYLPTGTLRTVADAANYHPRYAPEYIRTQGYSVVGIGGALYQKEVSQPSHSAKFSITALNAGTTTTVWYGLAKSEYPSVTVDVFGALGDSNGTTGNGTNDTAAFTASQGLGVPIHLRSGATYRIMSAVGYGLTTPLRIVGPDNRDATIYCDPAGINNTNGLIGTRYIATASCLHTQGTPGVEIEGVLLKNFTVDWGGATGNRCCQAINARYLKNARIENVEIKNGSMTGLRYAQWFGGWILNNYIHDFSNDTGAEYSGIEGDNDSGSESTGVVISGNRIINMLMSKVGFENTFSDVLLPDGYQPNGMKLIKGNHLTVTGNISENSGQTYDFYIDDSTIANNIAKNALAFCLPLKHSTHRNVVSGNDLQNCGSAGLAFAGDAAPDDASDNIVIGNRVTNVAVGDWADVDQGWGSHTIGLTAPATSFEENYNLAGNDSACIFSGVNSARNTVMGNSCDPGTNGDYMWRPGAGAGFVNYWIGNYGTPGIGTTNAGRYYQGGGGEPDSVHDDADIKGYRPWVDVAAAIDTPLNGSNLINVTGAATINDFIYGAAGQVYIIKFNGVMVIRCPATTLTANGNLACPNAGTNILTADGDVMAVSVEIPKDARAGAGGTGGLYRVLWYRKANGKAYVASACADITDKTTAGCALLTAADAAAQRTALGLGSMALQAATAVAITGGTWNDTAAADGSHILRRSNTTGDVIPLYIANGGVSATGSAALMDFSSTAQNNLRGVQIGDITKSTFTHAFTVRTSNGNVPAERFWCGLGCVFGAPGGGTVDPGTGIVSAQGVSLEGTNTPLNLKYVDAGSSIGPDIAGYRQSSTPAVSDDIGAIYQQGNDSALNLTNYTAIRSQITDPTDGSEDGSLVFQTSQAGTMSSVMAMGLGAWTAGVTGGDKGVNTFNAGTLYQSGSTLASLYQPLDSDLTSIAALTTTAFGLGVLDDADAAALRTTAGLGTMATQAASAVAITGGTATGLTSLTASGSGALSNNTGSTVGGIGAFIFGSDAGATFGPYWLCQRNSASPAAADTNCAIFFQARDSGNNGTNFTALYSVTDDPTDTSEDGGLLIQNMVAGTATNVGKFGSGLMVPAAATDPGAGGIAYNGKLKPDITITAGGTVGAQTINKPAFTVNFATGATSLVVTNSLVTTSSIALCSVRTADATAYIKNAVPAAGTVTITLGAAATAETSVGCMLVN